MKKILLYILFLSPLLTHAQTADTAYTDSNGMDVPRKKATQFITWTDRSETDNSISWNRQIYTLDHHLKASETVTYTLSAIEKKKRNAPYYHKFSVRNGSSKRYYDNGQLKDIREFRNGEQIGVFQRYYEQGQLKAEGRDAGDSSYFYHFYDSSGKDMLLNGSGVVRSYSAELGLPCTLEVKDSLLLYSYYIDTTFKDTVYLYLGNWKPETQKSWSNFTRKLRRFRTLSDIHTLLLQHDGDHWRIAFVIMEDGSIGRWRLLNSIHPDLDKALIIGLRNAGSFEAPVFQGRNVKVSVILPVTI